MASPFTADQPFKENNVINESERSVDPADDAGKLVQLESDGKIDGSFLRGPAVVTFTSSGTWTKDADLKYIIVEGVGAGGAGAAVTTNNGSAGVSGGGGGYFKKLIPAASLGSTETVTVGATAASLSSFGSHATANGGATGSGGTPGAGGTATGGYINITGQNGEGKATSANNSGGSSQLGHGGSAGGNNATGYGGGGSGSDTNNPAGTFSAGIIIVTEYY